MWATSSPAPCPLISSSRLLARNTATWRTSETIVARDELQLLRNVVYHRSAQSLPRRTFPKEGTHSQCWPPKSDESLGLWKNASPTWNESLVYAVFIKINTCFIKLVVKIMAARSLTQLWEKHWVKKLLLWPIFLDSHFLRLAWSRAGRSQAP